jgi:dihydrofolate synthase/folylpolyglutamate synthase
VKALGAVQDAAMAAALARLERLHPKVIDLSLDRIAGVLASLGHPERRLPPVFHVAGTNGKGSTLAFLRAFLEAAGYRCHVYTSPHLVRFNERIRLAGRLIEDDALIAAIETVERAADGRAATSFEMTTAVALQAFAGVPADAALIEVGLGGMLDATNVFERPHATAVTRVSFDHRQFLGDTLAGIAAEKAGIFKRGVPAVMAEQPAEIARATLAAAAEKAGAPPFAHGVRWRVAPAGSGFRYEGPGRTLDLPPPGLVGRHQVMNAGTALAMLDAAGGFTVDADAVRRGLAAVEWPARLQRLRRGPLIDRLMPGAELWLDGGHNDSGGEVLGIQAATWRDRPLDLVCGMLASKEPSEFLAPLVPFAARLRAVAIPDEPGSLTAEECAAAARAIGIADARPIGSVAEAVGMLAGPMPPPRILICGSLYLAGAVLRENG